MSWKKILKEDLKNPPFKMAIDRAKPYTDIDEFTDSLFHMEKQPNNLKKIYLVVKEVILGGRPLSKDEIGGLYYHYTKKDRLTKPEARMLKTLIELNDSPILNEIVEYVNLRELDFSSGN
jgi:hypothetical protein